MRLVLAYSCYKFLVIRVSPLLWQGNHPQYFTFSELSLKKKRGVMKENRKDHSDNTEYRGSSTPSCDSLMVEFSCGKSSLRNPSES